MLSESNNFWTINFKVKYSIKMFLKCSTTFPRAALCGRKTDRKKLKVCWILYDVQFRKHHCLSNANICKTNFILWLCYAALLILVPPKNIPPYRQILFSIASHRDDSYASSLEFFTLSLSKIILNIFHTFLSTKLFPLLESIRIRNF